jgi:hypothetical protein
MNDTRPWNFTHNNEPIIVVEVPASITRESEVIKLGLAQIGQPNSPHPCRAWPKQEKT